MRNLWKLWTLGAVCVGCFGLASSALAVESNEVHITVFGPAGEELPAADLYVSMNETPVDTNRQGASWVITDPPKHLHLELRDETWVQRRSISPCRYRKRRRAGSL